MADSGTVEPRVVLTFPGQGSQRPGMGRPWRDDPAWALVDAASAVLDTDCARLLCDAGEAELRGPQQAQLAVFLTGLLAWEAWRAAHPRVVPAAVAGHSSGELTALVALDPLDGVTVVAARGRAMAAAAAAAPGAMAALLGPQDAAVEAACAATGQVWPASFNAPGHVVISGRPPALAAAARRAGARRTVPLPVGGAYHTPDMAPAREPLAAALAAGRLRDAETPGCNLDATPRLTGFGPVLVSGLTSPVRWRQTLEGLAAAGATELVELGSAVLSGLARRTVPHLARTPVRTPGELR